MADYLGLKITKKYKSQLFISKDLFINIMYCILKGTVSDVSCHII